MAKITLSEHHPGTHLARFRTIHHELNVLRFGMLSSLSKTVRDTANAFFITGETVTDTLFHAVTCVFRSYIF